MAKPICLQEDPSLVRYDATALKPDGYYCSYDSITNRCYTDAIIYDGTGIKDFTEEVPVGSQCTGQTFVDYDGTGMKPLSKPNVSCSAV